MDLLYEESASCSRAAKEEKKYKIINPICKGLAVIGVLFLVIFVYFLTMIIGIQPSTEEQKAGFQSVVVYGVLSLFMAVLFGGLSFLLALYKKRLNISYDYLFVSGELRISKVYNQTRRKLIDKIQSENILQLGDVDADSYDRICNDPSTKQIVCSSNQKPGEGKFFLYVHTVQADGRKLFILECRETLLVHMLKFVKRGILAPDYVAQEKKQAR